MFYQDLTPYEYGRDAPSDDVLNIGWLSREHAFPIGDVPPEFVATLRRLVSTPINQYRGLYDCEFCPEPSTYVNDHGLRMAVPSPETSGNGEIRVTGLNGVTFVAPALVAHYVDVHKYRPPAEFVRAVLSLNVTFGA